MNDGPIGPDERCALCRNFFTEGGEAHCHACKRAVAEGRRLERDTTILDAVLSLLQDDPHQWSTRPCPTCRTITGIVRRPFGCSLVAARRDDKR